MEQTLPLPTLLLIRTSDFLLGYWWILGLCVAGVVVILKNFFKTQEGQWMLDRFKIKIPLIGQVVIKQEIGRFARTLSSLLSNGVPILEALEITKDISRNRLVSTEIEKIQKD